MTNEELLTRLVDILERYNKNVLALIQEIRSAEPSQEFDTARPPWLQKLYRQADASAEDVSND